MNIVTVAWLITAALVTLKLAGFTTVGWLVVFAPIVIIWLTIVIMMVVAGLYLAKRKSR
jgi:hypothetical protein